MADKFHVVYYSGREEAVRAAGFEVKGPRQVLFFDHTQAGRKDQHLRVGVKLVSIEFTPPPEQPYGDPSRYKLPVVE